MSPTRREFIKRVGIALASLMAARCACVSFIESDTGLGGTPRERLRKSWQRFGWLEKQASDWNDYEKGEKAREELVEGHRAALDELVAAGELDADVADLVQEAYAEAACHVWRANCRPLSRLRPNSATRACCAIPARVGARPPRRSAMDRCVQRSRSCTATASRPRR
jgi:hypothetical protein